MSNIQKFKKGDLVKVLTGHVIYEILGENVKVMDIRPERIGKEAIIEYSYAEMYGGNNTHSYSIKFVDSGTSIAWKKEHELELIKSAE